MVAIVSGNGLGLLEGSAAALGQRGVLGNAAQGKSGEGAFLNIATGNLVLQRRDDYLASRGLDVEVVRTYNAQGKLTDDNADNWGLGLARRVANLTGTLNTAGSSITRIEGDGSETVYTYDTSRNLYLSTQGAGAHDTLAYNSQTKQWLWTDGNTRNTETYDGAANGRLIASADTNGNKLTYQYNSAGLLSQVTDASGENTYFDYAGTNLTQVRVVTGSGTSAVTTTRVRYEYDANNRLAAVITDLTPDDNSIADGKTYATRYTYDGDSKRIASLEQSDGTRLAFAYEQAGANWRVKQVIDGEGRITRLDYAADGSSTTVTDALGYQTVYTYDAQGQLTDVTGPLLNGGLIAGVTRQIRYTYDAQGNVTHIVDGQGNTLDFEYDANGNQTLQRDAAGNTVRRTYGSQNQLLTETVYLVPDSDGSGAAQPAQGLTTRSVYDSRNQLRFNISPEGRVTEYRYNSLGERTSVIQYNGNTYDVGGLAEEAAPSEAQLNAWVASADKLRTSRTNYGYTARGLIDTMTLFTKVDAAGNGNIYDGECTQITYIYDQAGQLLQSIDVTSGTTSYVYDGLGRLLSTTNALKQATLTRYDDAQNSITTTLANGLSTTSVYNKAGELIGTTQTDPNAALLGQTRYHYDADGRLRMTENPTGQRSYLLYDAAGRKIADIDADGSLVEYVYNGNDQLVRTIRYANTVDTALLVNADGTPADVALAALRKPDPGTDRIAWNSYDAAGRLVKSVDAQGFVTQIDYDGASRTVRTVRYANAIDTTALGAEPTPAAIAPTASADDRITRSFHDKDGKLRGELDAEGYLTAYRYDAGGRLVETVSYATATDAALRVGGSLAQLIPATDTNDIRQYRLYDGKGQLTGSIDGEGYLTEFVYDRKGNVSRKIRYATPVTYAEGAAVANLRPSATSEDQIVSYAYTPLEQLWQETAADGTVTRHLYDEAGNLVSTTRASGVSDIRISQQRFDRQGRLTAELSAEGAARLTASMTPAEIDAIWNLYAVKYQYDAAGQRIGMTDQNGNRTLYYYDRDGRLAATVNAQGEVETRTYNAYNELIGTRRFGTRLAADTLAGLSGGKIEDGFAAILAVLANNAVDSAREFRYDNRGMLAAQYDELGARTAFQYDAFGKVIARSEQIDADNVLQHTYRYDHRGLQTQVTWDPSGLNTRAVTRYDAFGRAIESTDANGHTRTTSYDRAGRAVQLQDAEGSRTSTTYDAFDRVLTQTDSLGNVTRTAYNTQQRSVTVTTAEGIVKTVTYNRHGQQYQITDGNGKVTTFAYDKNGALLSITDALGNTVTNTYDRAGNLATTRDGNNVTTSFKYDAANRVLTRTVDAAGLNLVTAYNYDAKGQTLTVTDPNGIVTRTEYDAKGQVKRVAVDPDGLNQVTQFSYDGRGKTLQVIDANGHVTQYKYDTLGRRTQQIVDPDGLRLVTRFAYDANGNVVARTDANGHVTRFAYDANGRMTHEVDAAGGVTEYRYDANGRVIQTVRYANAISLTGLDTVDVAIAQADIASRLTPDAAHDNSIKSVYDRDGRLVFTIDGNGTVSRRVYDGNGNVIRTLAYAKAIALNTPATVEAVQAAVDVIADAAHDALTVRAYDVRNRVTAQVDGGGAVITFAYDNNGNVLHRRAYASRINVGALAAKPSAADILAQVVADDAHDQQVRMVYDAANRLTASATARDMQWSVVRQSYDKNGNVVSRTALARPMSPTFTATVSQATIQSLINAVAADSAQDRTTRMAYDAANRLVYSIDAVNTVTQRVYDAVGNAVKTVTYATPVTLSGVPDAKAIGNALTASAQDHVARAVYDAANRAVYDIDALGNVIESKYDAAGNVTAVLRRATPLALASLAEQPTVAQVRALVAADAADRLERQVFDADNRLRYSIDAAGFVQQNDYDALGRVTRTTQYANRITLGTTGLTEQALTAALQPNREQDRVNTFAYDTQGNLIQSTDALGGQESYTYDALGRKLSFTNKKGATWDYQYDAAGRMIAELAPPVEAASLVAYVDGEGKTRYRAETGLVRPQTRLAYDAFGNVIARTEAAGTAQERTTRYEYDAQGHQIRTIFPRVAVYDAAADSLSTAGAAARVETAGVELSSYVAYDALGNAVMSIDAAGNRSYKTYDRAGRVAYEIDAKGFVTRYERNAFGDVTALTRYADTLKIAGVTTTPLTQAHVQVAQLYAGLLNRSPSLVELNYNADAINAGRSSMVDLAQKLIDSSEARNSAQLYPVNLTNPQFVARVYQLVLGRAVDAQTVAKWSAQLDSGIARGRVAVDILNAMVSYAGTAPEELARQAQFNNKVSAVLATLSQAQLNATGVAATVAGFNHAQDRVIRTQYDALGRTVKVIEPQTYAFDQHSVLGSQYFTAGKATETRYNAFGEVVRESVYGEDAQGMRTTQAADTHFYFNARGEKIAQVVEEREADGKGGQAQAYLSTMEYDAAGNLTRQVDYANAIASWNDASYGTPQSNQDDREIRYVYDRNNRKVAETRVNVEFSTAANGSSTRGNVTSTFAYDAVGNLTRTTDALGNATYTYYDAVGRASAVASMPLEAQRRIQVAQLYVALLNRPAESSELDYWLDWMNTHQANIEDVAHEILGSDEAQGLYPSKPDGMEQSTWNRNFITQLYNIALGREPEPAGLDFWLNHLETHTPEWVVVGFITGAIAEPYNKNKVADALNTAGSAAAIDAAMPLAEFKRDIHGNVVQRVDYSRGARFAADAAYAVDQAHEKDRITSTVYDSHGHAIQTVDAEGNSAFASYDKSGQVAKQWQTVTGNDGVKQTTFKQMRYDELGQLVEVVEPDAGGAKVRRGSEYNAFGEVVRKSVNGNAYEYTDYDNAGHAWRTNSGDGVDKVMLYDVEGQATAEIRSASLNLKTYAAPAQIVGLDGLLFTETRYDLMGRAIAQIRPTQYGTDIANSLQPAFVNFQVISSAVNVVNSDDSSDIYRWAGNNEVDLKWMSLAGWGSGDVKVELEYVSKPLIQTTSSEGTTWEKELVPAQNATYSQIFSSDQAVDGVKLTWGNSGAQQSVPGVHDIKRLQVWKKDVKGEWVRVINQSQPGTFSSFVHIQAPVDPTVEVTFKYRLVGSNGAFQNATLSNFGDTLVLDTLALPEGNYEYQILHNRIGDAAASMHDSGTLAVTSKEIPRIREKIAQIYVLLFNRGPELDGLNLWTERVRGGQSIASVIEQFLTSDEAAARYANGFSREEIVGKIYHDVLGMSHLTNGASDWMLKLSFRPRGEVLAEMLDWIKSYSGTDALDDNTKKLFANKVEAGLAYAVELAGNSGKAAKEVTALVTATSTSAAIAQARASVVDTQRQTQIAQLYVALFNRAPDKGGLDAWFAAMRNGMTWEQVANGMLNSAEANNPPLRLGAMSNEEFVTHLYKTVLNRAPDADGLASWTGKLVGSSAISRGLLATQIANDVASYVGAGALELAEKKLFNNKAAIGLSYANDLGYNDVALARAVIATATSAPNARAAADEAKAATALAVIKADNTDKAANAAAGAQPLENLRTQVAQLYVALLNRLPEKEGLDHWLAYLNSGKTIANVADSILGSAEAKDPSLGLYPEGMSNEQFIDRLYQLVLNRPADSAGRTTWLQELQGENGQPAKTRGQVAVAVINAFLVNPASDAAEKFRQDLFNNKVAVGLTYALYLGGNELKAEREIIGLVTASDTSAAIAAALAAAERKAAKDAAAIAAATASAETTAASVGDASADAATAANAAADALTVAGNTPTALTRLDLARLYYAVLDRAPDLDGLNFQVDKMQEQGLSLVNIAENFLTSDEAKARNLYPAGISDANFVERVYLQVLGRPVDAASAQTRAGQFAAGMSRGAVLVDIINDFVNYADLDASEHALKAAFNKKISDNLNTVAAEANAAAAQAADEAGPAAAQAKEAADKVAAATELAAQKAEALTAAAFAAATATANAEATSTAVTRIELAQLFYAILNREPDLPGLNFLVDEMQKGLTLVAAADNMLISDEAAQRNLYPAGISDANFVERAYLQVLGRQVDAAGAQLRAQQFAAGMSRGAVLLEIIHGFVNYAGTDAGELALKAEFNRKIRDNLGLVAADAKAAAAQAQAAVDAGSAADTAQQAAEQVAAAIKLAEEKAGAATAAAQAAVTAADIAANTPTAVLRTELTQLYTAILGKAPDLAGLNTHVDAYQKGTPLKTLADNIVKSDESQKVVGWYPSSLTNKQFVEQVYLRVLGRSVDGPGAQLREAQLAGGMGRGELILEVIRGFVNYAGTDASEHALKATFNRKVRDNLNTVAAAAASAAMQTSKDAGDADSLVLTRKKQVDDAKTLATQKGGEATSAANAATAAVNNAASNPTAMLRLQLTRLYAVILNRPPDLAGFNHIISNLQNNGLSMIQAADNMLGSAQAQQEVGWYPSSLSNAQFAAQVYLRVLGRQIDDAGAALRASQFAQGMTRGQVLLEIINGFVNYAGTDANEHALKAAFDRKISNNLDTVSGYASSAETSAYNTYRPRKDEKDSAQKNYDSAVDSAKKAADALSNAATAVTNATGPANRGTAALAVPQDLRTAVTRLYISILNREPKLEEVSFWGGHLQTDMTVVTVAQSMLVDSAEGRGFYPLSFTNEQFVSKVYSMMLGRPLDPSGRATWTGQLNSGKTRGEVLINIMAAFLQSSESNLPVFNARVNNAMTATFNEANGYITAKKNADDAYSKAVTAKKDADDYVIKTYNQLVSANAAFDPAYAAFMDATKAATATSLAATVAKEDVRAADAAKAKAEADAQVAIANAALDSAINAAKALADAATKATAANSAFAVAADAAGKAVTSAEAARDKAIADADLLAANAALAAATGGSEQALAKLTQANAVVTALDAASDAVAANVVKATAEHELASANNAKIAAEKLVEQTAEAVAKLNAAVAAATAITAAADAATTAATAGKARVDAFAVIASAANMTPEVQRVLQITQLYVTLLDREPEFNGLRHWVERLEEGRTLAQSAEIMLAGDEAKVLYPADMSDADFIKQLYNIAFDRPVEPAGLAFWLAKMQGQDGQPPMTRADVILGLIHGAAVGGNSDTATFNAKVAAALTQVSQEAQHAADHPDVSALIIDNVTESDAKARQFDQAAAQHAATTPGAAQSRQVALLYAALLDRIPEAEGFNNWLDFINSGKTFAEAVGNMLQSDEAKALYPDSLGSADFISQFYRVAFNRAPDAAELADGINRIAAQGKGAAVAGIIESALNYAGAGLAQLASREVLNNRAQFALSVIGINTGKTAAFTRSVANTAAAIADKKPLDAYVANAGELQEGIHGKINGDRTAATPVVTQKFDRWGNVVEITDARNPNWVTKYKYNANNQVTEEAKPDANGQTGGASPTTRVYYDQLGRTVATRDARGYVNGKQYDSNGNLLKELQADGGVVEYAYNIFGDRTRVKQANGTLTSYAYDHLGRITSTNRGEVDVYGITYLAPDDRVSQPTNPVDLAPLEARRALIDTYRYDELGRRISSTNAAGETTTIGYDLRGNVISTRQFDRETRSEYDAFNHKVKETDANGNSMTWQVDAFGKLISHVDLGGATVNYEYNKLNQLTHQTNGRGQNLIYTYDEAGLLTRVEDVTLGQVTEYRYDLAGNRLREKTTQQGAVVQDNHLGYDTQGRLVSVDDGRYSVRYTYDANGNRTNVHTHYIDDGDEEKDIQNWNAYDAMNRQTIVDGVRDDNGNIGINDQQGHRLTYDQSGNRTSDTYYGRKIVKKGEGILTAFDLTDGYVKETYVYDAANRLTDVYRDDVDLKGDGKGLNIDARRYDAAGRVVYGGMMAGYNLQAYEGDADKMKGYGNVNERLSDKLRDIGLTPESRTSVYENGLLKRQNSRDFNFAHTTDLAYEYDKAGNLKSYDLISHSYGFTNHYDYSYEQREGYNVKHIDVKRVGKGSAGATSNEFDANGNLIKVDDATKDENDRTLVNDVAGHVLLKTQGKALRNMLTVDDRIVFKNDGNLTHALVVNGEMLGSSSNSSSPDTFGVSHVPVNAPSLTAPPSSYVVHKGDTLQGIARAVWGDGSLWYLIAEANGLTGNVTAGADGANLVEGQVITIPSRSSTVHNDFSTSKPYDPSSVVGDTTPNLPVPADQAGCGGVGQIVTLVVVAVLTYVAPWGGSIWANMAYAAVASTAGQAVSVAAGEQEKINWKQVATAALSAGATSGINIPSVGNEFANYAIRSAVNNVVNQGINIAVGLQEKFNWRAVAASAIAAPIASSVGAAVGNAVGSLTSSAFMAEFAGRFAAGVVTNGVNIAVHGGGKMQFATIAADAFGNALGSSIADGLGRGSQQESELTKFRRMEIEAMNKAAYEENLPRTIAYLNSSVAGPGVGIAQAENAGADARADFLRMEKSSYQHGDFDRRDVTRTGDTLADLFKANYGYAPSHDELVRYGNYNNLSDAHDVSVNREIISPSLEELQNTPITPGQLKSFAGKDAYFAAQRQAQLAASEQPAAGPVWSFREASMAQRKLDDVLAAAMANYAPAATVSPAYKAVSSAIGMVADGLGVIAGGAMTITGAGLTAAPEPTTLTKWAGVPLTAFGATYTAKSAVGFGLNFTNFVTALKGSTSESAYMPGSALEWAVRAGGGSPEHERLAVAADMAWGLASGRVLDARLATGVVTNPRVAALFQPALTTTVNREMTIMNPQIWSTYNRMDPRAAILDWGPKVYDNVIQPLEPQLQKTK